MSAGPIIILLVALLAAGALLAARAGIRSIQRARKVVFYRTRRSYMLAGWQWLVLALVLFSSTVASALFGEQFTNQLFPSISTQAVTGNDPTASPFASLEHLDLPSATLAPKRTASSPALTFTQTGDPSQASPDPATVTPTRNQSPTIARTILASATSSRNPSPTANL